MMIDRNDLQGSSTDEARLLCGPDGMHGRYMKGESSLPERGTLTTSMVKKKQGPASVLPGV